MTKPDKGDLFVVLDIETTGLDCAKSKIMEIAAIRVNPETKYHSTFQSLIKSDKKIPKNIVSLTGITDEMLLEGEDIESAINQLEEFVGDLPIVIFNAEFDIKFIKAATNGKDIFKNNQVICALNESRKYLDLPNYKLSTVADFFGIDRSSAHRALDDCVITLKVYDALVVKMTSDTGRFYKEAESFFPKMYTPPSKGRSKKGLLSLFLFGKTPRRLRKSSHGKFKPWNG